MNDEAVYRTAPATPSLLIIPVIVNTISKIIPVFSISLIELEVRKCLKHFPVHFICSLIAQTTTNNLIDMFGVVPTSSLFVVLFALVIHCHCKQWKEN